MIKLHIAIVGERFPSKGSKSCFRYDSQECEKLNVIWHSGTLEEHFQRGGNNAVVEQLWSALAECTPTALAMISAQQ